MRPPIAGPRHGPPASGSRGRAAVVLLLPLAVLALAAAVWLGLVRLGWRLPFPPEFPLDAHGPLMVSGFLGTLIGVERAVATGRRWTLSVPLLTGAGSILLLARPSAPWGAWSIAAGSAAAVAVSAWVVTLRPGGPVVAMGLGSASWLAGNVLWVLGEAPYRIVPWWAAFLILTVAGERLELSRLTRPGPWKAAGFRGAVATLLVGAVASRIGFSAGVRLGALAWLLLAAWLLVHDVARRRVGEPQLVGYVATGLLGGYVWLGIAGILGLLHGARPTGFSYDALIHSLFLGFVFSMIFAHAPVILPSVLKFEIAWHPAFYAPLALLHVSLALRVVGDLARNTLWRRWGGALNALAIGLFVLVIATAVLRRRSGRPGPG